MDFRVATGIAGMLFCSIALAAGSGGFDDPLSGPFITTAAHSYQYEKLTVGGLLGYSSLSYEYKNKADDYKSNVESSTTHVEASLVFPLKKFRLGLVAGGLDSTMSVKVKGLQAEYTSNQNITLHGLQSFVAYTVAKRLTFALQHSYQYLRSSDIKTSNNHLISVIFHNKMLEAGARYRGRIRDQGESQSVLVFGRINLKKFDLGLSIEKDSKSQLSDSAVDRMIFSVNGRLYLKRAVLGLILSKSGDSYKDKDDLNIESMGSLKAMVDGSYQLAKKTLIGGSISLEGASDENDIVKASSSIVSVLLYTSIEI